MDSPLIYIVEDESDLAELVAATLVKQQLRTRVFATGKSFLQAVKFEKPHLALVDLNLPDVEGTDLITQLRLEQIGIVVLSGRDQLSDRVKALELGADDYITKPFEPVELLARVQSVLRRILPRQDQQVSQSPSDAKLLRFADWTFDSDSLTLTHKTGESSQLSKAEGDMLSALLARPRQILSREQLIGDNMVPYDRSIDVRMSRLRKKLEFGGGAQIIKTVYGVGYMLVVSVE